MGEAGRHEAGRHEAARHEAGRHEAASYIYVQGSGTRRM